MAFNPLASFRRHSKGIFAVLTIVCMITFVLSSGVQGDAFQWLIGLLGTNRGEAVTTLYGDKVYEGDLHQAARLRNAANVFTQWGIQSGVSATFAEAGKELARETTAGDEPDPKFGPLQLACAEILIDNYASLSDIEQLNEQVQAGFQAVLNKYGKDPFMQQQFRAAFQRNSRDNPQRVGEAIAFLKRAQDLLTGLSKSVRNNDDHTRLVNGLRSYVDYRLWQMELSPTKDPLIFGGTTLKQDLLDFMVWKKQADRLGIRLTDEDVRKFLNALTPNQPALTGDAAADAEKFREALGGRREIAFEDVYKGLAEEFRVLIAQGIILGREPGLFASAPSAFRAPLGVTPGQYADYYTRQRDTVDAVLLPIPAEAFVAEARGGKEPNIDQLRNLYENYRLTEQRPDDPRPGFKEPARARVEWFSPAELKPETYHKVAEALPLAGPIAAFEDPRDKAYRRKAELFTALWAGIPAFHPFHYTVEDEAYQRIRRKHRLPGLLDGNPRLGFVRSANLRSTRFVGKLLLAGASSDPLTAAGLVEAATVTPALGFDDKLLKAESAKRAGIVAALVGLSPGPSVNVYYPLAWAASEDSLDKFVSKKIDGRETETVEATFVPPLSPYLPREALRAEIRDEVLRSVAEDFRRKDVDTFLTKLGEAKGNEAAGAKLVAETVKALRWEHAFGASTYEADRHTLAKDPGLLPLRASLAAFQRLRGGGGEVGLGELLFQPQMAAVYSPRELPTLLFWKSKHTEGRPPESLAAIRDKVENAWYLNRARELAEKEAEAVAARLKGLEDAKARRAELDKLAAKWGELATLEGISRLRETPSVRAEGSVSFDEFKVAEHDVPYPKDDFVDKLVGLGKGEVAVLADRPEKTYYVALVTKRYEEPGPKTMIGENRLNPMMDRLEKEQEGKYAEAIMVALRRDAAEGGRLTEDKRFELRPGIRDDERSGR